MLTRRLQTVAALASAVARPRQPPHRGAMPPLQCPDNRARRHRVLPASLPTLVPVKSLLAHLPSQSPVRFPRWLPNIPPDRVKQYRLRQAPIMRRLLVAIPLRRVAATRICTPPSINSMAGTLALHPSHTRTSGTRARLQRRSIRVRGVRRRPRYNMAASTRGGELGERVPPGIRLLGRMTHGPCLDGQGLLVRCVSMTGSPVAL